ncbi:MAG: TlpA family protein disulfide reductase [Nitrospirae bacterium]|nr:TlpA family protein disulfide reductase [Nitrospirota bacterium]
MKSKGLILTIILLAGLGLIAYSLSQREGKEEEPAAVAGLPAPKIEVSDALNGKELSQSEFKNKVVFVNFWASWCDPCREEMPSIERLAQHFKNNQDFQILTILFRDDPKNGISFLNQNGLDLPLMIDKGGETAKSYGLTGVPETYIIDKKGILKKKIIGPYEWYSAEVIEFISGLLKE